MSPAGTWVVRFAETQVAIEWRGAPSVRFLRFLFGEPGRGVSHRLPPAQFRLHIEPTTGACSLFRQGECLYQGPRPGVAAGILLDWMIYALAVDDRAGPLFHAAALAWHGTGLLLPGKSGSGKTTLAAWLSCHGYDVLSDELVRVDQPTGRLRAFPRPFHLRNSSVAMLEQRAGVTIAGPEGSGRDSWQSERGWLVPTTCLNPHNTYSTPPLSLLLFPHYRPHQSAPGCRLVRLSPAQAGLRFMECLINARNLVGHGFAEVVGLARGVPAYCLTYAALDQVREQIDALLEGR